MRFQQHVLPSAESDAISSTRVAVGGSYTFLADRLVFLVTRQRSNSISANECHQVRGVITGPLGAS